MTKKDYVLIAKVLAHWSTSTLASNLVAEDLRQGMAQDFAREFVWENSGFDRERFLKACKVTS